MIRVKSSMLLNLEDGDGEESLILIPHNVAPKLHYLQRVRFQVNFQLYYLIFIFN